MKTLVITGALGHIGAAFIHALRGGEWDSVVLLDNLSTQRYGSLFNLPRDINFRFYEEDITSADLETYFEEAAAVIHLAAMTNPEMSLQMVSEVERVNLSGTERVAKACAKTGAPLIFLSTTSVYGTHADSVDENCSAEDLIPQNPYAQSKLHAEQRLLTLGSSHGLRFLVCRFGTIFGWSPGMRFHTAINKFCWQACTHQPMTVWRTALNQQRPYLDLSQGVQALKFILERNIFDNQIYNVLSANATVGAFMEIIQSRITDSRIEYVDSPVMNTLSYQVLNAKFERLGFQFDSSLKEGVFQTLERLWGLAQGRLGSWGA